MGITIEYFFMYPLLFLYLSVKLVSFFQNIIEKKRIHKSSRYFSQVKLDFFRFIYW